MTKPTAFLVRVRGSALGCAGLVPLLLVMASSARAVSLSVVSPPPVQNSGDTASVCVQLNSQGQEVVGTENELEWNSACASIVGDCSGDNLRAGPLRNPAPGNVGVKGIVLNLQNLSPIPDGILYCCNLRVHPETGSCCDIRLQKAGSSDAGSPPKALVTSGGSGRVCIASTSGTGGGLQGGGGSQQPPVLGADLGTGQQPSGEGAPAPQAGGGGGILGAPPRPPVVVMPGGGGQDLAQAPEAAQTPTAAVPAPGQPAAPAARPPAVVATLGAAPTPASAPATAPPAPAATAAKPAPPAAKSPIAAPPRAAETKRAVAATPESRSGCHCEIGSSGASGWSSLALVFSVAAILVARRRRW